MGLILPPWYFNDVTTNLSGTPVAVTPGTSLTVGANNADGTAVTVLSALAHDVHLLQLYIFGYRIASTLTNTLVDLLVDPAGGTSWSELIDSLVVGHAPAIAAAGIGLPGLYYTFPVFIKAGTSIGVRGRTSHSASITGRVVATAYGNPSRADMWWCGQKVESLGINAASSKGTDIIGGTGIGTSGSYGTFTTVGTSTHHWGAVQFGINGADGTIVARGYHWQIGYDGNQLPGSPVMHVNSATTESLFETGFGQLIGCDAPAGTVWQARAASSGTAPDDYNVALYGVY